MKTKTNTRDLTQILCWVLYCNSSGKEILDFITDAVYAFVTEQYFIKDVEKAKRMIKADFVHLLYRISTGKIKKIKEKYIQNRLKRIIINLFQADVIENKIYFSELENIEEYIYQNQISNININTKKKNAALNKMKNKTIEKIQKIEKIKEFCCGCITEIKEKQAFLPIAS
ncbi:MAG: hypothetical protein Q9M37_05895 [Desulfonauticus sp.]|nr:hypothetical protein [Desulfonauticus sp.]